MADSSVKVIYGPMISVAMVLYLKFNNMEILIRLDIFKANQKRRTYIY